MPSGIYKRTPKQIKKLKKQGFQKGNIPCTKGKRSGSILFKCKICSKRFYRFKSYVHWWGAGKFCSNKCKGISMRETHKGEKSPAWRGGKINSYGYTYIHIPKHPNANGLGYVREHRLVFEKQIGRYLNKKEVIHHINEIRNDNRIENLMLFSNNGKHKKHHNKIRRQVKGGRKNGS